MKSEEIKQFKRELEAWVDFNSKSPMTLFDISKLLAIIKGYYYIKPKKK